MKDQRDDYVPTWVTLAAIGWLLFTMLGPYGWTRHYWMLSFAVEMAIIFGPQSFSTAAIFSPNRSEAEITTEVDGSHRSVRREYGELIRHFASGVMTVDEFEEREVELREVADDNDHRALDGAFEYIWSHYDDFRTERLRDEWSLTKSERRHVARCVLFLQTDLRYEWPSVRKGGCRSVIMSLLTLGLWYHFVVKPAQRMLINLEYAAGVDNNRGVYLKFG